MALAALALATSVAIAGAALAADTPVTVDHPWLRATPRSAPVAGGYATITNHGKEADALVSASLPMAPEGQIHSMTMTGGVMEMRRLPDGLSIPPGATVTLKPGGDHMMFIKPTAQLKEGESVRGTLTFKRAGTVPVTFAVGGMAARSAPGTKPTTGAMGHMPMNNMPMNNMPMNNMPMDHMPMNNMPMDHMH